MSGRLQIDFTLWGVSTPPKEISRLTSINPEVQFLRGERNSALGLPKENLWALRSTIESDDLADHWRELELKLLPSRGVLKDVSLTGTVKLTVIVRSSSRIPPLVIPVSMVAFAAQMGAAIDIDHLQ